MILVLIVVILIVDLIDLVLIVRFLILSPNFLVLLVFVLLFHIKTFLNGIRLRRKFIKNFKF